MLSGLISLISLITWELYSLFHNGSTLRDLSWFYLFNLMNMTCNRTRCSQLSLKELIRTLPKRQGQLFISDLVEIYNTFNYFCYLNFLNNFKEKERIKQFCMACQPWMQYWNLKKQKRYCWHVQHNRYIYTCWVHFFCGYILVGI